MLKDTFISKIDYVFLNYKPSYLVKNETDITSGTAYCNYHFRQALLGLSNDFTGKTKPEIEETMFSKTGRKNFNHISNLRKAFKESGLPIEIVVGQKSPFAVKYLDNDVYSEVNSYSGNTSFSNTDESYLPTKTDIESVLNNLSLECDNVKMSTILNKIENICISKGLILNKNWKERTMSNIKIWFT